MSSETCELPAKTRKTSQRRKQPSRDLAECFKSFIRLGRDGGHGCQGNSIYIEECVGLGEARELSADVHSLRSRLKSLDLIQNAFKRY